MLPSLPRGMIADGGGVTAGRHRAYNNNTTSRRAFIPIASRPCDHRSSSCRSRAQRCRRRAARERWPRTAAPKVPCAAARRGSAGAGLVLSDGSPDERMSSTSAHRPRLGAQLHARSARPILGKGGRASARAQARLGELTEHRSCAAHRGSAAHHGARRAVERRERIGRRSLRSSTSGLANVIMATTRRP